MPTDAQLPAEGARLKDIAPRAFQHPADKAASAALSAIPQLDRVVRKLIELGYERALRQSALGASVRLSEERPWAPPAVSCRIGSDAADRATTPTTRRRRRRSAQFAAASSGVIARPLLTRSRMSVLTSVQSLSRETAAYVAS